MILHAVMSVSGDDTMRRYRLSTLMLLVVIAALSVTLAVQHQRAVRREADLRGKLAAAMRPGSQSWWNTNVQGLEGKFDTWSRSTSGNH
jgi:hypothetical protein